MKIGNLNATPGTGATTAVSGERKATSGTGTSSSAASSSQASTSAANTASAQVDLSSTASLMSATPTDPTFDADKVDRISSAIKDGSYQVNADVIADKMISNAREVLARASNSSLQ